MNVFSFQDSTTALKTLLAVLLKDGEEVPSRNGTTKELTHARVVIENPLNRELLVPERKHHLAAQIAETMWVLAGRNDVQWLGQYLPRAKEYSDDGVVWRGGYGPRIRAFGEKGRNAVDQLDHVIKLLKKDPGTRQALIGIYDPRIDTIPGLDIPCNDLIQFLVRDDYLSMHVYIRSNDLMWGWSGINCFEWSALQEVVAGLSGFEMGELHFSIGSLHLYEQHWVKAQAIVDDTSRTFSFRESPRFTLYGDIVDLNWEIGTWMEAEHAIRTGQDPARFIDNIKDPMFKSWIRVIAWWWTGDRKWIEPLEGTRLAESARMAIQPLDTQPVPEPKPDFLTYVKELHEQKAKAYGNSWKSRGEIFSVLPNIARKVDRLGRPDIDGETRLDTYIDLCVYLAMYRLYLTDEGAEEPIEMEKSWKRPYSDHVVEPTAALFAELNDPHQYTLPATLQPERLEDIIRQDLDRIESIVLHASSQQDVVDIVDEMLAHAFALARAAWDQR